MLRTWLVPRAAAVVFFKWSDSQVLKMPKKRETQFDRIIPWILLALSMFAFIGAVLRVTASQDSILQRLDTTTLSYLAVAGALLLLRSVKSLAIGDWKVEFDRIKEIAAEARDIARIAEDTATYQSAPASAPSDASLHVADIKPGPHPDDPWKGAFGSSHENDTRRLRANVAPLGPDREWFKVDLVVEAKSPRREPLKGTVQFFLHQTFTNDRPLVQVGPNGKAELHLKAWGAFTVGALADDGATKLELDLAELADAPADFRAR